ncbi:MAG: hypothetical protein AB7N76_21100 [Planctomycetota bacterium]
MATSPMRLLATGTTAVLQRLVGEDSLVDARLLAVSASMGEVGEEPSAVLRFAARAGSRLREVRLELRGLLRVDLYWEPERELYHVERCKRLRVPDGVYLSLDPFDEELVVSEEDRGVFVARDVSAYGEDR